MLELFKQAESINRKKNSNHSQDESVAKELAIEYSNIPLYIIQYFFVRHSSQGNEIIQGFENFNIKCANFYFEELDKDQLQDINIIDYAPFAHYDEPHIIESKGTVDWYKNYYFKYGTWEFPIIAIKQKGKLFVIDGTNRFRHMLICLKNNLNFIKEKHLIHVIEECK